MVPLDDFRLKGLRSNDPVVEVDNRRATGDLGLVGGVGTGDASELGISLLVGAEDIKG